MLPTAPGNKLEPLHFRKRKGFYVFLEKIHLYLVSQRGLKATHRFRLSGIKTLYYGSNTDSKDQPRAGSLLYAET